MSSCFGGESQINPMQSPRPIRIAHVVTNLEIGGAETALERLVTSLDPAVFDNTVWSLRSVGTIGQRLRDRGIAVHAVDLRASGALVKGWRSLRQQVRGFAPDVLQGWMYHGNIAASALSRKLSQPARLSWNVRGSLSALSREKLSTRLLIRASCFFTGSVACIVNNSSSSVQDHVRLGYPHDRWCVIPNGFDTERFRPRVQEREALRRQFGLPPTGTVLLGVLGRHHPIKGHEFFIEAVTMLARQGHAVAGVLAGPGWEPHSAAARRVQQLGMFHCLGAIEGVERFLPALDVLCLPSLSEGFPNVVAEAMSCGVPCVASKVGDVPDIVGTTGEVVAPGSADGLRAALEKLVLAGEQSRLTRGLEARQRVVQHYSHARMLNAYERLYVDLARQVGK